MSSEAVISLKNVGKFFEIYKSPRDRLWQILWRGKKKFYKEYWACADINLDVYPGQCLGIVGRNGAGKSTLLQLIAGTLTPSSGNIAINGRLAALLELGSGFNPEFTGKDNVYLNAAILGLSNEEIKARYDDIAAFADIGDFMDRPVKTYSSGMALRLAFAVMANVDADILVIDEALAVGDAFFTQKCMRFLRDFIARHTVIFVSHDTNAVCSLCTDAILMESGRITLSGGPMEVSQKYLEGLYSSQQSEMALGEREINDPQISVPDKIQPVRDMRQDLLNASNLRNDLEIFPFHPGEEGFGTGRATVEKVWFSDLQGRPCSWIVGGEKLYLHMECAIHKPVALPVAGFLVNNAFGQQLFGDNTWLACKDKPLPLEAGDSLHVRFGFQMPILAPGEYYVTAAIGEGTPQSHIQHHWLHAALAFTAHTSSIASGLVGAPMFSIEMERNKVDGNVSATDIELRKSKDKNRHCALSKKEMEIQKAKYEAYLQNHGVKKSYKQYSAVIEWKICRDEYETNKFTHYKNLFACGDAEEFDELMPKLLNNPCFIKAKNDPRTGAFSDHKRAMELYSQFLHWQQTNNPRIIPQ